MIISPSRYHAPHMTASDQRALGQRITAEATALLAEYDARIAAGEDRETVKLDIMRRSVTGVPRTGETPPGTVGHEADNL